MKMSVGVQDSSRISLATPQKMQPSSSRILYDIPCRVCQDHSSGKHYGIFACDGCAGFFKRSIRKSRNYACKAKSNGNVCMVDKAHRNQCRACRLHKCIEAGMNKDAVQHERGPRNSTLRRQMAMYYKEPEIMNAAASPPPTALNLAMPKRQALMNPRMPNQPITAAHQYPPIALPIYCTSAPPIKQHPINMAWISAMPNLTPFLPSIIAESVCEEAAKLLFENVNWVRELNRDSPMCVEDQLLLLEESWRELFLVLAAQVLPNLDPTPVLAQHHEGASLVLEVRRFREAIAAITALKLSLTEYACIKAILYFQAGIELERIPNGRSSAGSSSPSGRRIRDLASVIRMRDYFQMSLGQCLSTNPLATLKFGHILMTLPQLRSVSAKGIQSFFFKRAIQDIPVEKVICDVYVNSDPRPCNPYINGT